MDQNTKKIVLNIATIGLSACIVMLLLVKGVISLYQGNARDIWIIIGLSSILLMILLDKKGATVFMAVLIIGTLVAREEFLLEIAALTRGEHLSDLRSTRQITQQLSPIPEIDESKLVARLGELLNEEKKADEIVPELEHYRTELNIERDIAIISDVQKRLLKFFASNGFTTDDEKLIQYMIKGKFSEDEAITGFDVLLAKEYIALSSDVDGAYLTKNGESLAKKLGYKVVDQKPNNAEQSR